MLNFDYYFENHQQKRLSFTPRALKCHQPRNADNSCWLKCRKKSALWGLPLKVTSLHRSTFSMRHVYKTILLNLSSSLATNSYKHRIKNVEKNMINYKFTFSWMYKKWAQTVIRLHNLFLFSLSVPFPKCYFSWVQVAECTNQCLTENVILFISIVHRSLLSALL